MLSIVSGSRMSFLGRICRCKRKETLVRDLRCIIRLFSTEINFQENEERTLTRRSKYARRLWSERPVETDSSSPFDGLGSWLSAKPKSVLQNLSYDSIGHFSSLGYRDVNEDRFKIVELAQDFHYIGVFDGHGGDVAVDFVSEKLHKYIMFMYRRTKNLEEILKTAFEMCNEALAKYCKRMVNTKGMLIIRQFF